MLQVCLGMAWPVFRWPLSNSNRGYTSQHTIFCLNVSTNWLLPPHWLIIWNGLIGLCDLPYQRGWNCQRIPCPLYPRSCGYGRFGGPSPWAIVPLMWVKRPSRLDALPDPVIAAKLSTVSASAGWAWQTYQTTLNGREMTFIFPSVTAG